MTAHEDYWLAMSRGARIVDLIGTSPCVCSRPRRSATGLDGAPLIMPMNFTLADERIVFRTLAHGAAAHAVDTTVAFEVDDIDDFLEAGWSVVVTGKAEPAQRGGAHPVAR